MVPKRGNFGKYVRNKYLGSSGIWCWRWMDMLYSFFWVIPGSQSFTCRRFGTLCSIFIGGVSNKNRKILPSYTTYEDGTVCSETSEYKIQKPGNHPKQRKQHLEHGESLKSRRMEMIRRTDHVRNE